MDYCVQLSFENINAPQLGAYGVDHVAVAEGLGCKAIRVRNVDDIQPAFAEAKALMAQHKVPVMAYSPIEQGQLLDDETLGKIADAHNATPAQIALAFVLSRPGMIAIPKSSNEAHVRENAAAAEIKLSKADIDALDAAFPPPRRKRSLEMI